MNTNEIDNLKDGDILILTELGWDEYAVEHFLKCVPIPVGEEVKFIKVFNNFYGKYLRCEYGGTFFDILPKSLKIK